MSNRITMTQPNIERLTTALRKTRRWPLVECRRVAESLLRMKANKNQPQPRGNP